MAHLISEGKTGQAQKTETQRQGYNKFVWRTKKLNNSIDRRLLSIIKIYLKLSEIVFSSWKKEATLLE